MAPAPPIVDRIWHNELVMSSSDGNAAESRVPVESDADIVAARQQGRMMATELGFSSADATLVATAISELARNIIFYAKRGEIVLSPMRRGTWVGLSISARDEGDGIPDIRQAMQDGYSTSGRLGIGLPGVRRLMDEFDIVSQVGKGTLVTATKWKQHDLPV
jgi:serine/threonine-protein kinase RsbT